MHRLRSRSLNRCARARSAASRSSSSMRRVEEDRSWNPLSLQIRLVDVAPAPVFAALGRLNERMLRGSGNARARGGPSMSRNSPRGRTPGTCAGAPRCRRSSGTLRIPWWGLHLLHVIRDVCAHAFAIADLHWGTCSLTSPDTAPPALGMPRSAPPTHASSRPSSAASSRATGSAMAMAAPALRNSARVLAGQHILDTCAPSRCARPTRLQLQCTASAGCSCAASPESLRQRADRLRIGAVDLAAALRHRRFRVSR